MNKQGRPRGWYDHLVHNKSVIGSLFTLIHLPFMLAFLSLVVIGALMLNSINDIVLYLSLAAVALLLYGEHMLDDTTMVGKPWSTVFSDSMLVKMGLILFSVAGLLGVYATIKFDTPLPLIGVLVGMGFCTLYGLEIWKFHAVEFGALGMGALASISYQAQALTTNSPANPVISVFLVVFGFAYGYVMLALYEHTKTDDHKIAWKLLGVHFIMIYALAAMLLFSPLV